MTCNDAYTRFTFVNVTNVVRKITKYVQFISNFYE